jgi:hypothetical protein
MNIQMSKETIFLNKALKAIAKCKELGIGLERVHESQA